MLVHSSEHNLFKNLLLFITAKWCINKEQKQSKTKSQVFNICQEREATRRVFPSGPGAGAVVTAARLLGPPVSSGVWSQEPEIPAKKRKEKKVWTLFGWVGPLLEAEQSGQRRTGPQFSAAAWKSKRHGNHSRNHSWDRVENLDMCHSRNIQSCVLWIRYMIPTNLTKLFW